MTPSRKWLPRHLAARLARAKAEAAADPQALVLAADTVVGVGRRILGKPESPAEARRFLELLSGRRHQVHTGVALRQPDGRIMTRLVTTILAFQRLTDQQMAAYVESGEWQGKAGGYAIQGAAEAYVRALAGSFSGVVGLPLNDTRLLLTAAGWRA